MFVVSIDLESLLEDANRLWPLGEDSTLKHDPPTQHSNLRVQITSSVTDDEGEVTGFVGRVRSDGVLDRGPQLKKAGGTEGGGLTPIERLGQGFGPDQVHLQLNADRKFRNTMDEPDSFKDYVLARG